MNTLQFLLYFILIVLPNALVSGQELLGHINVSKELAADTGNLFVSMISENGKEQISTKTDLYGNFSLKGLQDGMYYVSIGGIFQPDTSFYVKLSHEAILQKQIVYPPKKCPYDNSRQSNYCPIGGHTEDVLPIAYGLPTERTFRRAKRGEVWLGGCIMSGCDPNWYCQTHKLSF